MIRRTLRSTRTDTLLPHTTLVRSGFCSDSSPRLDRPAVGGLETAFKSNGFSPPSGAIWSSRLLGVRRAMRARRGFRSEEHTSELQSLMRISYDVFCLKKKNITHYVHYHMSLPTEFIHSNSTS